MRIGIFEEKISMESGGAYMLETNLMDSLLNF